MFISKKHKALFIHIPKTAGTSVTSALKDSISDGIYYPSPSRIVRVRDRIQGGLSGKPAFNKHSFAIDVLSRKPELKSYFKFAIVRNPYDWVSSIYKFIKYTDVSPDTGGSFKHALYDQVAPMSFEEFVSWVTEENGLMQLPSRLESSFYKTTPVLQQDWIRDFEGNILVDHVGHLETIGNEMGEILKNIGIDNPSLPWTNKSKSISSVTYSDESKEKVADYFSEDFKVFGYKK